MFMCDFQMQLRNFHENQNTILWRICAGFGLDMHMLSTISTKDGDYMQ